MKLEFLCLKWAVTEKFYDYLYCNKFKVKTNNTLTYISTTAKLDATGQRRVSALSAFDFEISYKPGKKNVDADALSRYLLAGKKKQLNRNTGSLWIYTGKYQMNVFNMAETTEPLDI